MKTIEYDDKIPIYLQIKNYLYRQIINGSLKLGEKLPSIRQLAVDLSVNVNTVQRALSEMINEEIIVSKRGKGNFVTEDLSKVDKLKSELVTSYIHDMYENLHDLNISDDEILKYIKDYIKDGGREVE